MSLIAFDAVWEHQSASNTNPPDPYAVTVPSSSWVGPDPAPFGAGATLGGEYEVATAWAVDTGLWIRRNVVTDGLRDVLLQGRIENSLFVYWDGIYVGSMNSPGYDYGDTPLWQVSIPKPLADAGTHELAILCLDEGGGSEDTTYVYVTADYLPAMIPLQPQAPAKETLEWLTDSQICKDGTEERLKVRLSPRQAFEYVYPAKALEQQRAKTILENARTGPWLVPVWSQAENIGAVAADQFILACANGNREYRISSLALLWQDSDNWQVLGIDWNDWDFLYLTTPTLAFTNAWVMPLRFGHIEANPTRVFTGYNAQLRIRFEVDDNEEVYLGDDPTQYLGDDIYFDDVFEADNADLVQSPLDTFDPDLGLVAYYQAWNTPKVARSFKRIETDVDGAWAMRQFLHRRAGKYKQFWHPSFEYDLRITNTGTITNSLTMYKDEYEKYGTDRTHVAVRAAGTWYARAVTSAVAVDATKIQLNLDSALNVARDTVSAVCWLGLKRLDTDRVEIEYPGGGIAQSTIRIVEIDR